MQRHQTFLISAKGWSWHVECCRSLSDFRHIKKSTTETFLSSMTIAFIHSSITYSRIEYFLLNRFPLWVSAYLQWLPLTGSQVAIVGVRYDFERERQKFLSMTLRFGKPNVNIVSQQLHTNKIYGSNFRLQRNLRQNYLTKYQNSKQMLSKNKYLIQNQSLLNTIFPQQPIASYKRVEPSKICLLKHKFISSQTWEFTNTPNGL